MALCWTNTSPSRILRLIVMSLKYRVLTAR
jgi:hypothetical protein